MGLPRSKTHPELNYLKKTYLIYGTPKSGKTTIVSNMGDDESNKILFFATEPGHKEQSIWKYQIEQNDGSMRDPVSFNDFRACVAELINYGQNEYGAIAIDIVDNLYKWTAKHVCRKHGIEHESDLGFGKGYALIRDELMSPINALAQYGFGVFFISHSKDMEKQIGSKKLTVTDTSLPGSASQLIAGLCDYILYFSTDIDGNRVIRTKPTESINAGDRSGKLSELIDMDSEKLKEELQK